MFKKIFVVLAMMSVMVPSFAFAADFGLKGAAQGTGLINTQGSSATTIPDLIGSIVGIALSFVGAIFFLLILYAGFLWMTAFGSSEKVDKAKDIMQHAAIGLVIVLAAYAISSFVFSKLTEASGSSSQSSGQSTSTPGCCIIDPPTNQVCLPNRLQSNCTGSQNAWVAGACPSTCL